jgi:hypothetical protein
LPGLRTIVLSFVLAGAVSGFGLSPAPAQWNPFQSAPPPQAAPAPTLGENFSAKPAPQLFASDCTGSGCHRGPQGLSKGRSQSSLAGFLREHYTNSRQSAAAIAAYLMGVPGEARPARVTPPARPPLPRAAAKPEPADKPAEKPAEQEKPAAARAAQQATAAKPEPAAAAAAATEPATAAEEPAAAAPAPPPEPPRPQWDIFE